MKITSFTPAEGTKGTTVTITGTNFGNTVAENSVTFNGVVANVTAATANSLTVTVPKGAGSGKVSVHAGNKTVNSTDDFLYIYTVSTVAGDGTFGFKNGQDTLAQLSPSYGLTTDAAGNVYVADSENNRIRKISPSGEVSTLAGDGTIGANNGPAATAQFDFPHGLCRDANGNIYVADAANNMIRKITPQGVVSTFAGNGTPGLVEGNAAQAEFNDPAGVTIDAAGNLYVTDGNNRRIRKITQAGVVSTLGNADFGFPEGITIDAAGNLYVADPQKNRISRVTPAGAITTLAGTGDFGLKDGAGDVAQFLNPEGIAIDASGNLYVGDLDNNAVRKITPAGIVTTLAGNGTGYANGPGPQAKFYQPSGIAVDAFGNIYVTDTINSRIRKLD